MTWVIDVGFNENNQIFRSSLKQRHLHEVRLAVCWLLQCVRNRKFRGVLVTLLDHLLLVRTAPAFLESSETMMSAKQKLHPVDEQIASDESATFFPLVAVSGCYDGVHFFRLDTREKVFTIDGMFRGMDVIRCQLRDRAVLAFGSTTFEVLFADPHTRKMIKRTRLRGHSRTVTAVCDLPSEFGEDLIASGSQDQTVRVWKKSKKKQVACFRGHRDTVDGLCCIPGKRWLVSGSCDRTMRIWDFEVQDMHLHQSSAPETVKYVSHGLFITPYSSLFGSEHGLFFAAGDGPVRLFSLDTFHCVQTFSGPDVCTSLLLHPTRESLLFSGHWNGQVAMWDTRKGGRCVKIEPVHSASVDRLIHVGGDRFASCSYDKTVMVWSDDLDTIAPEAEAGGDQQEPWTDDWAPWEKHHVTDIETEGANRALCCLVPFEDESAVAAQALEERARFLLRAFADDTHIVSCSVGSFTRQVRCSSCLIRVWRGVVTCLT